MTEEQRKKIARASLFASSRSLPRAQLIKAISLIMRARTDDHQLTSWIDRVACFGFSKKRDELARVLTEMLTHIESQHGEDALFDVTIALHCQRESPTSAHAEETALRKIRVAMRAHLRLVS